VTAWQSWHEDYEDPASDLSRRLAVVQESIRTWADEAPPGPLRLVSICAGQGHDVIGALGGHRRRRDVSGLLVELDGENVAAARRGLQRAGLAAVAAVAGDAGRLDAYTSAVPADLVLVCGVFGNISVPDVRRTVLALPMLLAAGGTVVWTRHRREPDLTPTIRKWFSELGFVEIGFTSPGPNRFAVGTHRLVGEARAFEAGDAPLFTFQR
jgi:hypothetical protein